MNSGNRGPTAGRLSQTVRLTAALAIAAACAGCPWAGGDKSKKTFSGGQASSAANTPSGGSPAGTDPSTAGSDARAVPPSPEPPPTPSFVITVPGPQAQPAPSPNGEPPPPVFIESARGVAPTAGPAEFDYSGQDPTIFQIDPEHFRKPAIVELVKQGKIKLPDGMWLDKDGKVQGTPKGWKPRKTKQAADGG
jgi:hypothetical protein